MAAVVRSRNKAASRGGKRRPRRRWRPSLLTILICICALTTLGFVLYPRAAQWISAYNQLQVVQDYSTQVDHSQPSKEEQLRLAHQYNDLLTSGVELRANTNVPTGTGSSGAKQLEYSKMLRANANGVMARIRIPKIKVDLPILHGTDDATLLQGAGHLEGSSLPVGGSGTHSVITAHRGLANAEMFTRLNEIQVGDTFTVETFGEVLTYRVIDTRVVAPEDSDSLRAQPGKDLMTLVTCTPLGINTHRILVTGERVLPTPTADLAAAGTVPTSPGFPWWLAMMLGGLAACGLMLWRFGLVDARS